MLAIDQRPSKGLAIAIGHQIKRLDANTYKVKNSVFERLYFA